MWQRSARGDGKTMLVFLAAFRGFALVVATALLSSTGYFKLLSYSRFAYQRCDSYFTHSLCSC